MKRGALAALLAGATAIGFAPVLVRFSDTGPSATAGHRLLLALPFLWMWLLGERRRVQPPARRPATRRDYLLLLAAGLWFTGDLSLWHWSLQYTSVANSTLITNLAPVLVSLGAWAFWGEAITKRFLVGLALALGGSALLAGDSLRLDARHLLGDAIALVAAFFYAGYQLAVKRLRTRFGTATIMAWSGLAACPAFFLLATLSGETLLPSSARGWLAVAGLAVVCHVAGQTLIAHGFGHLPASVSSLSLLWQPVVAAALAWLLLGEAVSGLQWLGGVVVLLGIALATVTWNHGPPRPADGSVA